VGARNAEQALANAKAGDIILSPDDITAINGHLAGLQMVRP
jgi:aryl-alcohol dehydrogenase-like predicted oxidoreductase